MELCRFLVVKAHLSSMRATDVFNREKIRGKNQFFRIITPSGTTWAFSVTVGRTELIACA